MLPNITSVVPSSHYLPPGMDGKESHNTNCPMKLVDKMNFLRAGFDPPNHTHTHKIKIKIMIKNNNK